MRSGHANRLWTRIGAAALPTLGGSFAHAAYWNVFKVEGESSLSAQIVTYGTLADMLGDTNRIGIFTPNPQGFGRNIVGSGAEILAAPPPPPHPASAPGSLVLALAALAALAAPGALGAARRQRPGTAGT